MSLKIIHFINFHIKIDIIRRKRILKSISFKDDLLNNWDLLYAFILIIHIYLLKNIIS